MSAVKSTNKYFEAVGRRKTAVARVRIVESAKSSFDINGKNLETYFPVKEMQITATEAFDHSKADSKFQVSAKIQGGGISAQAVALRHGIARALLVYNAELRSKLKKMGYLKRDPRAKERRKFGLKKARKSPQWSKR